MAMLVVAPDWRLDPWLDRFRSQAGDLAIIDPETAYDPAAIRYLACWKPPAGLVRSLPNLEVIFNLGAGVDALLADRTLPDLPIVRVVDPDLTGRMVDYVVLHALFWHRRMDLYREAQARREWLSREQPPTNQTRVGIMGMGVLGKAAAGALKALGFDVAGWSRSGTTLACIETFGGASGLDAFLARTDILVSLLPATPDTRGLLNRDLFARLAKGGAIGGPALINAGRGALQVEADILAALDDGTLVGASLDVFEHEPLDPASPIWAHPKIILTPHNAADSDPDAIVRYVMEQVRRHEGGLGLENVVDRKTGY